ncbi:MAG: class I SAM-dependent methyltransferase [Anaerolineae bacterium]
MINQILEIAARRLISRLPMEEAASLLADMARNRARQGQPDAGLRMLLAIDDALYREEGQLAIRHNAGTHPKHDFLRYHDFFVDRLQAGQRVLDFGCGRGELTYDMAERAGAHVTGIEINEASYQAAVQNRSHPQVSYIHGDGLTDIPAERFDVIVLSNVLEHLDDRPGVLSRLVKNHQPDYLLIRVPSYEREWRVPMRDSLGVNYYLDPTHTIEYTRETFRQETGAAGLTLDEFVATWGEFWTRLSPTSVEPEFG